jgi:hypothetical protein
MPETIRVTRGATVNLGSYESARVEVSWELDVDSQQGKDFETLSQAVSKSCKEFLAKEVEAIQQAAGLPPRPVERFTG